MGRIGDAAQRRLVVHLEARVSSVERAGAGVVVRAKTPERTLDVAARQAVVATEAGEAARLLSGVLPGASAVLQRFSYAPVTLVQWAERTPGESRLPSGFGYLAPPVEGAFALGTLFTSELLGEATRTFTTFVGGALTPERAALSDAELVVGVSQDVQRLTGGGFGELAAVVRWPAGVFQPPVGHEAMVRQLDVLVGDAPMALAGSYLGAAAMRDAAAAGQRAAARLLGQSLNAQERAVA
jgi:protoporphyrinogen oxidase